MAMRERFIHWGKQAQTLWHERWLVRWLVANSLGWSLGLLMAGWALQIAGVWAMFAPVVLACGVVSGAQWLALRTLPAGMWRPKGRAWVGITMLAGAVATLPLYVLAVFVLLNHWLFGAIMGAILGGLIGYAQFYVLMREYDDAPLWVGANIVGGLLCAPITLQIMFWDVPILLSPGLLLFGWVTGWAWWRMAREE
jgi:hypothetical protein